MSHHKDADEFYKWDMAYYEYFQKCECEGCGHSFQFDQLDEDFLCEYCREEIGYEPDYGDC